MIAGLANAYPQTGNAKLAGMTKDINLAGIRYNWLGTIFYIAYILSQPLTIGWKQFKPHYWCATAVFLWGTIATVCIPKAKEKVEYANATTFRYKPQRLLGPVLWSAAQSSE